ncbi:PH domain-containing protein [Corynebacterium flavescens]|uniref:PH domain-containing protein n=1 Tax=Corynebacterium flavescens TaxID=28028 RepID=UPI000ED66ED8|nr:PH domain-containing protein [Corynebacterium flavescens]MDN6431961.1 PH domain-containing protein [Corynebacterium flavescens]MDN6600236.1 PH domain-containing protein [Corynebacterium flavescens]MDN6822017.1 PH domain-containing protein [Corynebacterium flavescens]HCG47085.1 hypothetical protein [Corynebacterium flavescens]
MALEKFEGWTFYQPCPIPDDIQSVLAVNEQPSCAFKTVRDAAVFTNYRLIIRDSQGLTGKKVEMYSIPYSSINMWSTENAGKLLDINAELELWTRAGHFKINIGPKIDIRALDQLISNCVFQ